MLPHSSACCRRHREPSGETKAAGAASAAAQVGRATADAAKRLMMAGRHIVGRALAA